MNHIRFLPDLDTNFLSDIGFANIFFQFYRLLFHLVDYFFYCAEAFNFDAVSLVYFFFCYSCIWCHIQKKIIVRHLSISSIFSKDEIFISSITFINYFLSIFYFLLLYFLIVILVLYFWYILFTQYRSFMYIIIFKIYSGYILQFLISSTFFVTHFRIFGNFFHNSITISFLSMNYNNIYSQALEE